MLYSESLDIRKMFLIIFVAVYSKKFVVPERGFLILFPQSLSPLAETVVFLKFPLSLLPIGEMGIVTRKRSRVW